MRRRKIKMGKGSSHELQNKHTVLSLAARCTALTGIWVGTTAGRSTTTPAMAMMGGSAVEVTFGSSVKGTEFF